jgi:hypothetical protein
MKYCSLGYLVNGFPLQSISPDLKTKRRALYKRKKSIIGRMDAARCLLTTNEVNMSPSLLRTLGSLMDAAFAKSVRRTPPKIEVANREMSSMVKV